MNTQQRIPLRPDLGALNRRAASLVPRSAAVALIAAAQNLYIADVLKRPEFRDDPALGTHVKAATVPASLTGADWASTLTTLAVPAFLGSLGQAAAFSALMNSSTQYIFDGTSFINVANLLSDPTAASFVGELAPIPVRALALGDGTVLVPKKLESIFVMSRETTLHSIPNLVTTVNAGITDNTLLAADTALFDANPATAIRPAGLRWGIAATAGESANVNSLEAMKEDIRLLVTTLSPIAANSGITLVASPSQAWALKLWGGRDLPFNVLMSSSIAAGQVIGIVNAALVTACEPTPTFTVSTEGTVHLDSVPAQIGVVASPNTVSAKVIDLWSSDCLGLKCSFTVAWGLRGAGAIAWLQNVVW